jgi:hypothetical protein
MEECDMEEILRNLETGGNLESAVEAFAGLALHEKIDLLGKLRGTKTDLIALFLNKILDRAAEREVQKSIKRLLFILKTQGISVEEPKITGESVLKKVEAAREQKAYLSSYDPEGTRVVFLAFEIKKRQFVFIHAVSHFEKGLLELAAAPVSRDELDDILKDYLARTPRFILLPPVSPKYAGFLVEEAGARSGAHADELRSLKPFMAGLKGPVQKPEDIYALPVPENTRPKSPKEILTDPVLEPFMLTWESIEDDKKELDAVANPSIVVPPYVLEERREAFLAELVQSDKLKSASRLLKRMLEDYAYLFHALGNFDKFKGVTEGLSNDRFLQDALLFFVKKSLEKKKEEEQGILVDPFKQQPPRSQPPYPRR